jgi:hypothetical protein
MWTPISRNKLEDWILRGEQELDMEALNLWNLIKVESQKWQEKEYGEMGGGFWVVAIFGKVVIYFNDIEEGFNTSFYDEYGHIKEYWCNQSELNWVIAELCNRIKNKSN